MSKQYEVTMECIVRKTVTVEGCTPEQARKDPWEYAVDEYETEQVDWEVLSVREAK